MSMLYNSTDVMATERPVRHLMPACSLAHEIVLFQREL